VKCRRIFHGGGLPAPEEGMARESCLGLGKGVETPDLAIPEDFLRFQVFTMRGKITKKVKKPTDDSLNGFVECFFAGFTRMIGTKVGKAEERSIQGGPGTNFFGRYTV
jgi:hypothetical protein